MIKFNWGQLSDSEFEDMCKDILREEGLDNVRRMSGPGSGDMGRDIVAEETVSLRFGRKITFKILIQCKNYGKSEVTIDPSEVERYAIRAETLGYDSLLIITSHDLSSQAKFIAEKISSDPKRRMKIDLWTKADLVDELVKFPKIRDKYFNILSRVEGAEGILKTESLKFKGFVTEIYIPALFAYEGTTKMYPIVFLVDTGATKTTILGGDAEKIGLDFDALKKSEAPVVGIGGVVTDVYVLSNVKLVFQTQEKKIHTESLEEVDVIRPKKNEPRFPFSILGRDILRRFKITFERDV